MSIFDVQDLTFRVCEYLSDTDSLNLFLICKRLYFLFTEYIWRGICDIRDLSQIKCRIERIRGIKQKTDLELFRHQPIRELVFDDTFIQPINAADLQWETLTDLTFGYWFDQEVNELPDTLQTLRFGCRFSRKVNNLPKSLHTLTLGNFFDQPVDNLPPGLQSLKFGYSFNRPIDRLPESLRHLICGFKFNQPIDHLPVGLESLAFGLGKFNQSIDRLPSALRDLKLSYDFNRSIDHLPESLMKLQLGRNLKPRIQTLPQSLEEIVCDDEGQLESIINITREISPGVRISLKEDAIQFKPSASLPR